MDYGLGLGNVFRDGKMYRITSPAGLRKAPTRGASSWHQGTDYAAPRGTEVVAPMDGVITVSGYEKGYGNRVGLCNGNKCVHLAHLDKLADQFKPNQRVAAGTLLGTVGSTGVSTGSHLDYTVTLNGKIVNHLGKVLDKDVKQSYLRGVQNVADKIMPRVTGATPLPAAEQITMKPVTYDTLPDMGVALNKEADTAAAQLAMLLGGGIY